jgi:RHS repeat-associated protein
MKTSVSRMRVFLVLSTAGMLLGAGTSSATPEWWTSRKVLVTNTMPEDFSPVLQGQIWWLATNAFVEFQGKMPGGAGDEVHQLLASPAVGNHFSPVAIGQLKNVAAMFYRRLMEEGVATGYPWGADDVSDFAPATVGQAKTVFGFDLAGAVFNPSISGQIAYPGPQRGFIRIVAAPVDRLGMDAFADIAETGAYHVVTGRGATISRIEAWRDSNQNTRQDPWEACGAYPLNPVTVTSVVSGIDLALSDPDEDGDGIPGYREIELGLDPDYPYDALVDADGDGVSLADELRFGSDPLNGDSDGDGMGDGAEILNGVSPTNGHDHARLPFVESFEPPSITNGVLAGQKQWLSSGGLFAVVSTNPVISGTQTLWLRASTNAGAAIIHPLATHGVDRLWIDYQAVPAWRSATDALLPAEGSAASFYINQSGQLVVYDRTWLPGGWVALTNTPTMTRSNAVRWTVQLDYERRAWGLWLNGTNVLKSLPFTGTAPELARLRFTGAFYSDIAFDQIAVTTNAPAGFVADSDGDGLPDDWERANGLDPYDASDASSDPDKDGLTSLQEYTLSLNPHDPDSDHDGWNDGAEAAFWNSAVYDDPRWTETVPFDELFEAPAVTNGDLAGQHGWLISQTNWALVQGGKHVGGSQSLKLAPKFDAVASLFHVIKGPFQGITWTDFWTIPVGRQISEYPVIQPATTASFYIDHDGYSVVRDRAEWKTITNAPVISGTNWHRFTVMQDFSNSVWSLCLDGVPVAIDLEFAHRLTQYTGVRVSGACNTATWLDDLHVTTEAPGDIDSDGDGLPNNWEIAHGFNSSDPSDASDDPDQDGLITVDEFRLGLDPLNRDTDSDGMGDGAEIMRGYSPTNAGLYRCLPFAEPFEPALITNGTLTGQHGWIVVSSNGAAVVQTGVVWDATQALQLGGCTSPVSIFNPVAAGGIPVVWTDLRAKPVFRSVVSMPVLDAASGVGLFVNHEGRVVARDGSDWMTLTNHQSLIAGAWSRFTTRQDYNNGNWTLYVNGEQWATNLAFACPAKEYSGFGMKGPLYRAGFLDAVRVSTNPPLDIDADGDGLSDDWEALYGLHSSNPMDSWVDSDQDGLSNLDEYRMGTNPRLRDTDGDGIGDGAELNVGGIPSLSNSYYRLPFAEGYEAPAVIPGNLAGQHGWQVAGSNAVIIQSNVVFEGMQALTLGSTGTATHVFASDGSPMVWIDLQAKLVRRLTQANPVISSNSAAAFYINSSGLLTVSQDSSSTQRWDILSSHAPVATGQWVRLTACLDYPAQSWSLWLNSVQVAKDLHFANTVAEFYRAQFHGPALSIATLDNLAITTNEPPGLDTDGDGLPNAWEIAHGFNPSDPSDSSDPDCDGLTNFEEYQLGLDPRDPDSDRDGLVDGHDGVMSIGLFPDGVDFNGDGFADGESDFGCDPFLDDSDHDGIKDGEEVRMGLNPCHSTIGQGLAAWYKLDETNGITIADSSTNNHIGEWIGVGSVTGTVGRMDGALQFDGRGNGVRISATHLLNLNTNFSISVWVCPDSGGTNPIQVIVAQGNEGALVLNQGKPEFRFLDASTGFVACATSLPARAWTHLVATREGDVVTLFVDGQSVSSNRVSGSIPGADVLWGLGYNSILDSQYFDGGLDDVRFYHRALAVGEIHEIDVLGGDFDGDTAGNAVELMSDADPFSSPSPAEIAGDLDGDGRVTRNDRDLLVLLVGEMTGDVTRFSYDAEGNVTIKVDAMGNATAMTYDRNNRLLGTTDAKGHAQLNEMDVMGAVVTTTDALGARTRFAYDAFGSVIQVTDAAGNATWMEYNTLGQVVRTVNSRGTSQVTLYDDLGRVECVVASAGTSLEQRSWSYYDAGDNLVSNRNNIGVINEYQYDSCGKMVKQILARRTPGEKVDETTYDARGLAVSRKDSRGYWSYVGYDALARQVSTTDALGHVTQGVYDNLGKVIACIQPNGRRVQTDYDKWGRAVRVRDGNDVAVTDYDVLDRVVCKTDWRGIRSAHFYDAVGNPTNTIEALGTPEQSGTMTFYDAGNRPVRRVNAKACSVATDYDALGNKTSFTDEFGHVSRWYYAYGKRLEGYSLPDGTVVTNYYDALDRLVEVRVNGTTQQAYSYDKISRLTNSVDFNQAGTADDSTVAYDYDALNQVVEERQNGKRVQRQFDAGGHAVAVTYPSGFVLKRSFDANGRLATLKNEDGTTTYSAYTYTPNSRIQTITYGNGVVEAHGLDSRERLHTLFQQGVHCDLRTTLARDPGGNVTLCSQNGGAGDVFIYDSLSRVVARKNLSDVFEESLRYDALGNWLSTSNPVEGSVSRSVNSGNQYDQIGAQSLRYDLNGNLIDWNNRNFVYDYLARLVEVRSNGQVIARNCYDAANRRVGKDTVAGHQAYFYDGDNLIDESVNETWTRSTIHGGSLDTPVAMVSGGAAFYYLRNWRANVAVLVDSGGNPVESYQYSLFGRMTVLNAGGNPVQQSGFGNIWTFAGRQWDVETGLMHNRNRTYSAELGRFLQRDPAGYVDGMNLYAYAGNNPLMFSDPYGLYRWSHGALDSRVGDWIFKQYGQIREIERQRREYEEALRQAEEERQRIERENEYAARAFSQYKNEHAREIKDMAGKYRHLGVNENEAAQLLMSGITSIPRLGATVGPNDTRRGWWLDYYLRGGQINNTMRDEMRSAGIGNADEFFAKTSQKETALRDKRKATQQQYTMAAVAIVATVVTCGAGGVLGSALLGTVGVTATTASFGAFVVGAVAIQGVSAAATTMISHGNIGDFAQSWAINSAASVAGYGAGYSAAKAGADLNIQLATQSAASTFVSSGSRAALEGEGFKNVFRDTAISFVAGGMMGTFMKAEGAGSVPASFGEYVNNGASSTFGYLHSPISGGVQGSLHAAVYGGNMVEAFGEGAISKEALTSYLMASEVSQAAKWMSDQLVSALPNAPRQEDSLREWKTPQAFAQSDKKGGGIKDSLSWQSRIRNVAIGSAVTVASHLEEIIVAPARAVSEIYSTVTADTWKVRSHLINPFSRSFAGYQILDKATDAAQVAAGLPISFLSGDFMDVQKSGTMTMDEGRKLVTFNGMFNGNNDAAKMRDVTRKQFSVNDSVHVANRSAFWGIGDVIQVIGNELGLIDITAIRGAAALREASSTPGLINVVAHSQGSMTFRRALDLVDEPSVRGRIAYQGFGSEINNSQSYLGLQSAQNFWNQERGGARRFDRVPQANYFPLPARIMGDPFMMQGSSEWQVVDSPGNRLVPGGNRHGYQDYYGGYAY